MTNGNLEIRVSALEAQMQQVQATLQQVADLQIAGQQQLNQLGNRLEQLEQLQERTQRQIDLTLDIANSNARSIQAWESLIEQNKVEAEEDRSELRVMIRDLIRANQQNIIDHELFRRRFEAIDPLIDPPGE